MLQVLLAKFQKKEDKQETKEDELEKQDDLEKEKEVETLKCTPIIGHFN